MTLETRRSAEHHTLAAHHHEHAARHHHEAAKHFQNDDHAHAAHQAQIAYAHTSACASEPCHRVSERLPMPEFTAAWQGPS